MVVAKGADLVARRIREIAEEHKIPIVENPPLARALYATVELDERSAAGALQGGRRDHWLRHAAAPRRRVPSEGVRRRLPCGRVGRDGQLADLAIGVPHSTTVAVLHAASTRRYRRRHCRLSRWRRGDLAPPGDDADRRDRGRCGRWLRHAGGLVAPVAGREVGAIARLERTVRDERHKVVDFVERRRSASIRSTSRPLPVRQPDSPAWLGTTPANSSAVTRASRFPRRCAAARPAAPADPFGGPQAVDAQLRGLQGRDAARLYRPDHGARRRTPTCAPAPSSSDLTPEREMGTALRRSRAALPALLRGGAGRHRADRRRRPAGGGEPGVRAGRPRRSAAIGRAAGRADRHRGTAASGRAADSGRWRAPRPVRARSACRQGARDRRSRVPRPARARRHRPRRR